MRHHIMNSRRALSLITVASLLVLMTGMTAVAATGSAKDEKKLTVGITMLNSDAKLPSGEKVLTKQLIDEFGVKQDKITSLKGKNLNYGEIAVVLALADKMDGGVTDANINRVMGMKPTSSSGWATVAKNLNVDIAEVADKVSSIEDNAHSGIKEAALEAGGRGAGGGEFDSSAGGGMSEPESGETGGTTEEGIDDSGGSVGGGTGGSLDSSDSPTGSSGRY